MYMHHFFALGAYDMHHTLKSLQLAFNKICYQYKRYGLVDIYKFFFAMLVWVVLDLDLQQLMVQSQRHLKMRREFI